MALTNSTPQDTTDPIVVQSQVLQQQIVALLPQLSLERLQTVVEFTAYLLAKETSEAMQELAEQPELIAELQQAQATSVDQFHNWRNLRSDV